VNVKANKVRNADVGLNNNNWFYVKVGELYIITILY